jgi:integrase
MAAVMTRIKLKFVHAFRDRHGRVRHYFRRGGKRIPLPGLPGSAEFMATYEAALANMTMRKEIGASRTKPGTVNAAIVGYYQSLAYRELAPGTQRMRRGILERFRTECGDFRVSIMPQKFIAQRLSCMGPGAARNWRKTLHGLLEFAVAENFRVDNPVTGIKLPKHRTDGHHSWTDAEIAQYQAHYPIGTRERLAFELLLCTAQRRSDVVRMGPQHMRGDALHVRQDKTGAQLVIPIHPDLRAALSVMRATHPASSSRAIRPLTFITSKSGRSFSGNDFSTLFRTWCDAAGLPRRCTSHGLRKATARRLAEEGATTHQIAAITGHRSLGEVQRYTRAADQARLAKEAMDLISPKTEHQSGKPRNQSGKPN